MPLTFSRRGIAVAALGFLAAAPLAAQRRSDSRDWELSCSRNRGYDDGERVCNIVERTIPASRETLSIDGRQNGGIAVIGEDRKDVLIRARIEAHSRSQSRAEELADAVRIHTEGSKIYPDGPDNHGDTWWSVQLEVHVPAHSDLDLRAQNGGLAVAGVTGMLHLETQNGGIHLDAVNGDVVAETMNGGLTVELDGDSWEGRGLDARTTNGGVHLDVPRGYSAHLETGTQNGGLDIDFPVTVQGRIGRRISTDLGRGGTTIRVMTSNGGVKITRR